MKLNTKSRYAVMALADLAKFSSHNPVSLRDISLRQNISILYLEQIFLKLKKNNVVRSVRGINGGYVLNKNPEDIKIAQSDNEKNILKGTIKELEFLGSNIRGHIEVNFESEKANVICNFASEYILNNNIQNNSSVSISLQPHALKVVKA